MAVSAASVKAVLSKLAADLKFAVAHPTTVRKELLAAATSVAGDIAVFNQIAPNVPAPVATGVSAVQAVAVFVLTLLGSNESKASVLARKAK